MYLSEANVDLQVHPFDNTLPDIVAAMEKTGLDIVGLASLDRTIFPGMVEEAETYFPGSVIDDSGIVLPSGRVLLNSREYSTLERFQVLTVGYSLDTHPHDYVKKVIDGSLEHGALVVLDNPYVDNGKSNTAGHISPGMERGLERLCKKYSGELALEWNGYAVSWMRAVLRPIVDILIQPTNYHDINKKVEGLSERLKAASCNVPVVTDTDLHARSKGLLDAMGTARMVVKIEGETATDVVQSMKGEIFAGRHKNVKGYVGLLHMLRAYCFPVILPKLFPNPRG